MLYHKQTKVEGQSIIEVLIAVTLSAIVFISLLSLSNLSTKNATRSRNQNIATSYSSQAADWLRQLRSEYGWEAIGAKFKADAGSNETVSYCLPTLPSTQAEFIALSPSICTDSQLIPTTEYTRSIIVSLTELNNNLIKISIHTAWPDNTDNASANVEITLGKIQ